MRRQKETSELEEDQEVGKKMVFPGRIGWFGIASVT